MTARDVIVRLEAAELMVAAEVGAMRRVRSVCDKLNKNKHALISDWATDINGAAAEMAVAKHLGVYWNPRVANLQNGDDYKALDVAGWQVRSTIYPSGHLIIRENDPDGQQYIFVVSTAPTFRLVGTFCSTDAKRDEFKYTDGQGFEYWRVPQERMLDLPPKGSVRGVA